MGFGVAYEALGSELLVIFHYVPNTWCSTLGIEKCSWTEGRERKEEVRGTLCPSLCEMEGCSLGTGHRTPCVTHGTIGFSSPSPEGTALSRWHACPPVPS